MKPGAPMSRFAVALTSLGILAISTAISAAEIFPFKTKTTKLDNGLVVMSIPVDSPGIIAYYTVVRTGSRNEVETGLSGFAHFFEHMMFRGTDKYPQDKYNDALKALGANSNAFTTDDWTCYHMTVPSSALAKVVDLEADRFQNLKYDVADFQKESRAVLGEYNKGASSPLQSLNETMQDKAYDVHTYKHTTIGFLADVKDMPNQFTYSKKFFDRWYRPDNCTIIVAGDVDHDELVKLARAAYGSWKPGVAKVEISEEPAQTLEKKTNLSWPVPTLPIIYIGYHIPFADPKNSDWPALSALAQAVFGETSPLYQSLVLKEQKVVVLMADAETKRDPGLFTVLARVRDSGSVPLVQGRIFAALDDAAQIPIDAKRLDAIKSRLKYGFSAALDSPDTIARIVGEAIAITGRPESINELYDAYEKLTPADLQRVAKKYFSPSNRTTVILESEQK